MRVHSQLPGRHDAGLSRALGNSAEHVAQSSPEAAAADSQCAAFVGPWHSWLVAEAMEILRPAGITHVAPAATWVGLTRADEPGSGAAPARRTLFRIAARDMVVCRAIVAAVGGQARIVSDDTDYGRQIGSQLRMAGLQEGGDAVIYAGLGESAPDGLPAEVICMDGAAQDGFPERHPDARYFGAAYAQEGYTDEECWDFAPHVDLAGRLIAGGEIASHFDEHGDLLEPRSGVWRWEAGHFRAL
jgi:hypothetical protein